MFKYFINYIKVHIRKSQYSKMFLSYSLFTLMAISVTSFIMINYYNGNLSQEIAKSDRRLLMQVKISSDILIGDKVQSVIMDKFLDVSRDKNILDFFYSSSADETKVLLQVYDTVSSITFGNSFIDSIYIYRKSDDSLISSREGIIFSVSSLTNPERKCVNINTVTKIMSSSENKYWITPSENSEYWGKKRIISFAQSIPYFSHSEKIGCVIININEEMFFKSINNGSDKSTGQLVVIGPDGKIFSHSDPLELFQNHGNISYPREILSKDEGFITYTMNGKTFGISWLKSSLNDWRYVSITPIDALNRQVLIAKQFAIFVTLLVILTSIIFLRFITSFLYRPFKQFLKVLTKGLPVQVEANTDDLATINKLITNLSDKVEEMDETIRQNHGVIEYKIALDMIYGRNFNSLEEVNERLKILHKSFEFHNFSIIVSEIDGHGLEKLNTEQYEFIIYKIINLINDFLSPDCIHLSISIQHNRIVTITNYENIEDFQGILSRLMETLKDDPGISCNIALSNPTSDVLKLSKIFEEASNCLKYGYIYNYGNIFTCDRIEQLENNNKCFDMTAVEDLVPLFKACKTAILNEEVIKIFSLLGNGNYNYNEVQNVLAQFTSLICRIIKDQNIKNQKLDRNKILTDFNSIITLDEYLQWLLSLIDIYMENVHIRDSSMDMDFIDKVMDYIADNVDKQISLNSIAEKFRISPNYLSKIFKENTGINFSDFVIDKKLQKAKELLLSERDASISKVAEQLGYFNTPYFISIFKEKFGTTPSKCRKRSIL